MHFCASSQPNDVQNRFRTTKYSPDLMSGSRFVPTLRAGAGGGFLGSSYKRRLPFPSPRGTRVALGNNRIHWVLASSLELHIYNQRGGIHIHQCDVGNGPCLVPYFLPLVFRARDPRALGGYRHPRADQDMKDPKRQPEKSGVWEGHDAKRRRGLSRTSPLPDEGM